MTATVRRITNFKDLHVWQESIELVADVYRLCADLPGGERYALATQMKRAAVSVPSNIAAGYARNHRAEYRQAVYIAVGSLAELETHLYLCVKVGLLVSEQTAPVLARVDRLKAMAVTLAKRLS